MAAIFLSYFSDFFKKMAFKSALKANKITLYK